MGKGYLKSVLTAFLGLDIPFIAKKGGGRIEGGKEQRFLSNTFNFL